MKILQTLLILFVSIVYGLPNLILFSEYKENFTPFTLVGSPIARDEAFAYAPEMRYVFNNKSLLGEVYVEEYKKSPTPFMGETAPSALLAIVTFLSGSLEKAFIIADFVLPPIIFLALFYIARIFIKNNLFALSAAFVASLARDFIAVVPYPSEIIKYLTVQENQNYLLYFSRAFHPQVSFLFFLAPLISVFTVVKNPKDLKNVIFLGVSFGLVFYSYVFYWTLFCFFYLLLALYLIRKKEFQVIRAFIFSAVIAMPIAAFYLLNMFHFYQISSISDFVTKSSLHNKPLPIMLVRYIVLIVVLLITTKKKTLNFAVLASLLIAGVFIIPTSKFLIGQDLETLHYLRRAVMPFATISLFVIFYNLFTKYNRALNVIAAITIGIFLTFGLRTQLIATDLIKENHIRNSDLEAVMTWLNENTERSSVVGSLDPNFSSLIPVYTDNKVYMPPTDRTVMPTYEGIERYKILSELLGVDESKQKQNLGDMVSYFFVYQSYDQEGNLDPNSPRREQAEAQMNQLSKNQTWAVRLKQTKLDYVIATPNEKGIRPDLSYLESKTSINEYIIFKKK